MNVCKSTRSSSQGGGACISSKMILCRKFTLKRGGGLYSEGGLIARHYSNRCWECLFMQMTEFSSRFSILHYCDHSSETTVSLIRMWKTVWDSLQGTWLMIKSLFITDLAKKVVIVLPHRMLEYFTNYRGHILLYNLVRDFADLE